MIFYIIISIILYIGFGIITFGIGYKYNFLELRDDYRHSVETNDECSSLVMCIIFWPIIAVGILLFSIPQHIVDNIIAEVDEDMKYENLCNTDNKNSKL